MEGEGIIIRPGQLWLWGAHAGDCDCRDPYIVLALISNRMALIVFAGGEEDLTFMDEMRRHDRLLEDVE